MTVYRASYECSALAEARARAAGWQGPDDEVGMLDYIDVHTDEDSVAQKFPTKDAAEAWLKGEIAANRTLFGCGDIDALERVEPRARCRYCTCRGVKATQSFLVDDTGIVDEREVSDECWNGNED